MMLQAKYESSSAYELGQEDLKNFLLYLYVKSENPHYRINFPLQSHNFKYFGRGPLDDATCQI